MSTYIDNKQIEKKDKKLKSKKSKKSKRTESESDSESEHEPDLTLHEKIDNIKINNLLRSDHPTPTDLNQLLNYAECGGEMQVDYFRSPNNNGLYGKKGLQLVSSKIRGYLCGENYLDIDFVNCAPSILLDEIKKLDPEFPCLALEEYVEDRDKIKNQFRFKSNKYVHAVINGCKIEHRNPTVANWLRSIQAIADRVFSITGDKLHLQKRQSEYLDQLIKGLTESGCNIIAVIHDGVVIEKIKNINELINEWNTTSDTPVKIKIKPWEQIECNVKKEFDWTENVYFTDLNTSKIYNTAREALVENIKIMVKTIVVSCEWKTAVFKKCTKTEGGLERKSDTVKIRDIGIQFNIKDRLPISLVALMKKVPQLFAVRNISHFPSSDPNTFSLFRPFIPFYSKRPEGNLLPDIKLILDHIKIVWCNNNEHNFRWIENWFAFIFQKYPDKTNCIVQITGDEGTGKSCVFEWLNNNVLGELCIVLSGCEKLTRNFNSHLVGKLIVCLEEVGGDKQDVQRIKHIATARTIDIERKGIDVTTDINAINIICFSNLDNPIPPIVGINRRLVHFRSNPIYQNDKKYFKTLIDFLKSDKVAPIAFFHYYREYVIDYDLLFNDKPVTDEKNFNRFMSLQEVDRAVYYIIVSNPDETVRKTASEIVSICKQLWGDSKIAPIAVGRRLSSLGFGKVQNEGTYRYIINKETFIKYEQPLADLCKEFSMDLTPHCALDNIISKLNERY